MSLVSHGLTLTADAIFTAAAIFSNPHFVSEEAEGGEDMKLAQTHSMPLAITKNG